MKAPLSWKCGGTKSGIWQIEGKGSCNRGEKGTEGGATSSSSKKKKKKQKMKRIA